MIDLGLNTEISFTPESPVMILDASASGPFSQHSDISESLWAHNKAHNKDDWFLSFHVIASMKVQLMQRARDIEKSI